MRCPECDHEVRAKTLFCPNCGHKIENAPPVSVRPTAHMAEVAPEPEKAAHTGCGLSLGVLLIAALVLVGILGLGAAGAYLGMRDRTRVEQEAAAEHYLKGVQHAAQGEYELAVAEFEAVLQLDAGYKDVIAQLGEAQSQLAAVPTPTAVLQQEINAVYLDKLRQAYDQQDWQQVLSVADELVSLDATYARAEVDQMLFGAFYNLGMQGVREDRMQEAVRYLERALVLQPDNAQVARAKELATLYVEATAYWGADWAKASEQFGVLYALEPTYKDASQRTYEAYVSYGDQLAADQDWCGAKEQYTRAIEVTASADTVAKRQQADDRCRAGTPSPEVEPTPEPTNAPAATFVGGIVRFEDIEATHISVRGRVHATGGKGVGGTRVQIKAWDWSAVAVTDGLGQYSFDGLANPVMYTLSLLDLRSLPVDVPTAWGKLAWVDFVEP